MNKSITLNVLEIGDSATVRRIINNDFMKRRFLDLGLISGTKIKCVGSSASGDPRAYEIRGAVIAIRNEDCENIIIENICRR